MEINNISDAAVFQNSINLACEWAQMWQLKLATTKCQYMRVGLRRTDASRYSLNGVDLNISLTRMWANAQRDGRPAEHRWRPLFNAAEFG